MPISELLTQLRTLMQSQAEAITSESFHQLDLLNLEREPLVTALSRYTVADLNSADYALAEQVAALDQQLVELTRESIVRTGQEIRDLDRGRAAVTQYGQRGRNLIQHLERRAGQD